MPTVSVRLPEGIYAAVAELADKIGVSMTKTDVATLLLLFGLASVKEGVFSGRTSALIQADGFESYAAMLRGLAKMTAEQRLAAQKKWGEVYTKLAEIFPGLAGVA